MWIELVDIYNSRRSEESIVFQAARPAPLTLDPSASLGVTCGRTG